MILSSKAFKFIIVVIQLPASAIASSEIISLYFLWQLIFFANLCSNTSILMLFLGQPTFIVLIFPILASFKYYIWLPS
jgi:hypothetical protein